MPRPAAQTRGADGGARAVPMVLRSAGGGLLAAPVPGGLFALASSRSGLNCSSTRLGSCLRCLSSYRVLCGNNNTTRVVFARGAGWERKSEMRRRQGQGGYGNRVSNYSRLGGGLLALARDSGRLWVGWRKEELVFLSSCYYSYVCCARPRGISSRRV